ncbi:zf-DHHC-domain-containing protein [Ceraceosorus guamensis]|uniref:Palmitoyltransferase n=1 Tax=Ceraceosorus guamensis TaxID=1522189 RepID=A0A316VWV2_9BASI|nr:zf-DHHC-domain-containing protein [Ceraceosorus guamensis]PWN41784.1 zf-DHHC-domain-containing protein [Ceraceosorus guamensis]
MSIAAEATRSGVMGHDTGSSDHHAADDSHGGPSILGRMQDRRTPLKLSERIWVAGTLSLIFFLVLSVQYIVVIYYKATPAMVLADLALVLGPFNALAGFLLYNYSLAALSSPGRVPNGWIPSIPSGPGGSDEGTAAASEFVEVKKSGAPRWCKVCKAPKPPRAHHCRQCQRCTLRMDHHCPWIANCVGHRNYAAFIRFLAAVDVTCAYHLLMLSARVADAWGGGNMYRSPTTPIMLLMVLNYALCVPVLLLVGMFSMYHFYCAANNSTTIEGWEKDRVATMVRRGRVREIQYPYDLGLVRNLQASLGSNPLLWCWPQPTPGDGLHYPLRDGAGESGGIECGAEGQEEGWPWNPRYAEVMRKWAREARASASGANVEDPEWGDHWSDARQTSRDRPNDGSAWDALLRLQSREPASSDETQPLV